MLINQIEIDSGEKIGEIEERLRLLLSTAKGTLPMNRNYGIDFDAVIDRPVDVALNCYAAEVIRAVGAYEPAVSVSHVDFERLTDSGFKAVITLTKKEAA